MQSASIFRGWKTSEARRQLNELFGDCLAISLVHNGGRWILMVSLRRYEWVGFLFDVEKSVQ